MQGCPGPIIPRLFENPNLPLVNQFRRDSSHCMIRAGFLDPESRSDLMELTRDGSVAHRLARRANALLLLDDGMSCEAIAEVLFLDDDTIRTWHHDPHLASAISRRGHRGPGGLWPRRQRLPLERCPAGQAESLDHRDAAKDNPW